MLGRAVSPLVKITNSRFAPTPRPASSLTNEYASGLRAICAEEG
jgi:hypothetical protein